jgi:hypothetical protein
MAPAVTVVMADAQHRLMRTTATMHDAAPTPYRLLVYLTGQPFRALNGPGLFYSTREYGRTHAARTHARISSSWHACMNELACMNRYASVLARCCCCMAAAAAAAAAAGCCLLRSCCWLIRLMCTDTIRKGVLTLLNVGPRDPTLLLVRCGVCGKTAEHYR